MEKRVDYDKLKLLFKSDSLYSCVNDIISAYAMKYGEEIEYSTMARTLRKLQIKKHQGYYKDFGLSIEDIRHKDKVVGFNLALNNTDMIKEYDTILLKSRQDAQCLINQIKKLSFYNEDIISAIPIDDYVVMIICVKDKKDTLADKIHNIINNGSIKP